MGKLTILARPEPRLGFARAKLVKIAKNCDTPFDHLPRRVGNVDQLRKFGTAYGLGRAQIAKLSKN